MESLARGACLTDRSWLAGPVDPPTSYDLNGNQLSTCPALRHRIGIGPSVYMAFRASWAESGHEMDSERAEQLGRPGSPRIGVTRRRIPSLPVVSMRRPRCDRYEALLRRIGSGFKRPVQARLGVRSLGGATSEQRRRACVDEGREVRLGSWQMVG